MKKLIGFFAALLLMINVSMAQTTAKATGTEEVKIKTSAVCEMCKASIEKALSVEKGVKSAKLDVSSKVVTVVYRKDKTNADKIRTAVSKTGYDADQVPADTKAYEKLHPCCKKGAH